MALSSFMRCYGSSFDRASLDWHGVATLAVWSMTLLIQRTEHRDTQALQAKLDELLHAHSQASNALTKIDDEEPEDIVRHREPGSCGGSERRSVGPPEEREALMPLVAISPGRSRRDVVLTGPQSTHRYVWSSISGWVGCGAIHSKSGPPPM